MTAILTPNLEVPGRRSLHRRDPDPDAERFGHLAICDRPSVVFGEITEELAYALIHRDRNVQVEPGPSDLAVECNRALAGAVACLPEPGDERDVNWRADVGTAIHAMFEGIIRNSLNNSLAGGPRWLVETELTIGYIDGRKITGHCDLFDLMALGVVDYKALPLTEPIATPHGWTTMGALLVGSQVLGTDYRTHRVTGVHPQGSREVYRVEFSDGTFVRATADHLWTVERFDRTGGLPSRHRVTVPTEQLRYRNAGRADRLPIIVPGVTPDLDMPIDPYVLGVWIGDGSKHHEAIAAGAAMTVHLNDTTKSQVVGALLTAGGHVVPSQSVGHGVAVSLHIEDALDHYGLRYVESPKRFLPTEVLRGGSPEQRRALLAGLMDTDGTITTTGSVQFHTTSPQLADDVAELVRSLGGWAKLWRQEKTTAYTSGGVRIDTGNHVHIVSIRLPFNPFRHNDKGLLKWMMPGGRATIAKTVTAVVSDGIEDVQCITVDAPDSLFLTRGLAPTHNSKSKTQLLISRRGLSLEYRRQLNLYGYGWEQLGLTPNWVGCLFLPRDGEWSDTFPHAEPYDRALALATLERADTMAKIVRVMGVEAVWEMYAPCGSKWCRWCPPPGRTYRQSGAEEEVPEGQDAFG